jgi:hypothetical protein
MHDLYRAQKFEDAYEVSAGLVNEFDGKMSKYYDMWMDRCRYMQTQDLPKDWNGVFVATSK